MRVFSWGVFAVAASLALASCGHGGKAAKPTPSPLPAKSPAAVPVPSRSAPPPKASLAPAAHAANSPSPVPSVSASAAPRVPVPAPTPSPAQSVPRLSPDAPPEILDVQMSETEVQPGDSVSGNVITSSNVASVEARIGGYGVTLRKVGVGHFALVYKVGQLPWFVRGNFNMQVIARNTRGAIATREIHLKVR